DATAVACRRVSSWRDLMQLCRTNSGSVRSGGGVFFRVKWFGGGPKCGTWKFAFGTKEGRSARKAPGGLALFHNMAVDECLNPKLCSENWVCGFLLVQPSSTRSVFF